MPSDNVFQICVLPGDGIGTEVTGAAVEVLTATCGRSGQFALNFKYHAAGAELYLERGVAMPDDSWRGAEEADAIFLGAMGLPRVRYDDGTEITPQLDLRFRFDLYAGVRPVSASRGGPPVLKDSRANDVDFVLVRESTEGLFASCGKGEIIGDREARDTLVITRERSKQVFEFAFELARNRASDGKTSKVTLVDKANVFSSMAFFRKVFDEVANAYPDIETERLYVDACALDLVRRPWEFDVLVTENMFGDILSDLGPACTGTIAIAPSANMNPEKAHPSMFEPVHGSAPDITGKGIANPIAAIWSAAMMCEHLGEDTASSRLMAAIVEVARDGKVLAPDLGGDADTDAVTDAIIAAIRRDDLELKSSAQTSR